MKTTPTAEDKAGGQQTQSANRPVQLPTNREEGAEMHQHNRSKQQVRYVNPAHVVWYRVPGVGLIPVVRRPWSKARKARFMRTVGTIALFACAWALLSIGLGELRS
ncbi:hypothetical protein AB0B66_18750 [Catellatospora sp. NPDC049111]|uniref:hypothetical protein n=1 Tax=Catellatospora sp. NPDC049111 TaxID=3155271 RepID=UPI0033CA2545